jgi:phytoene synthase
MSTPESYAHCEDLVRKADRERYDTTLFASASVRPHLLALYAFNVEISSLRERVKEPLPGEMRLQWWRDALNGTSTGETSAHPVAAALIDTIVTHALPVQPLLNLIDARLFDLYDDLFPTHVDLEGYLGETASVLMQLAALILSPDHARKAADAAGHAGLAYGLTGLMRAFPFHLRKGRCFLPKDRLDAEGLTRDDVFIRASEPALTSIIDEILDEAERHHTEAVRYSKALQRSLRPALLPLALVPAQLKALRARTSILAPAIDLSPLGQLTRLWAANRFGF